jgi:hypothetical protein
LEWSEGLAELDLGSVFRLRPRSGQMEVLSLTASYDFSSEEYARAAPGTRALRTVLHETTHAYQALATSYGYFYSVVRAFQDSRVLAILHLLDRSGRAPRPPLIRQILTDRRGAEEQQLRIELYAWYVAELMLLHLEGDVDILGRQIEATPALTSRPLHELFHDLEGLLTPFLTAAGHQVRPTAAVAHDNAVSETLLQFTLKALSPGWGDTVSVMESGGRMAEYWEAWPPEARRYDDDMPRASPYSVWIQWARRLDIADGQAFALTYSALADLALNPPVLPHQARWRPAGMSMNALSPVWRLLDGVSAVSAGIPPIRDLSRDYVPFVEAVCAANGWPAPAAMAAPVLEALPGEEAGDPRTALFGLAQRFRQKVPYAFVDLEIWMIDGPAARLFRDAFVHPIIQFTDRVLHHRDRSRVVAFLQTYAMNQYLRQLMIAGNRPVELPARLDEESLAALGEALQALLVEQVGGPVPPVRLVTAPSAAHP